MAQAAMFGGLVVDENGNSAELSMVGANACYVVYDDDFKRHVDAETVDRQVLKFMREQVEGHRDIAVNSMMDMMGKDDLFTKVALEKSIDQMEDSVGQPLPEDARQWLGMMGLKIVIDFHGEVLDVEMPGAAIDDDDRFGGLGF
ncbi:MAG: hypothetical protein AAF639_40985 [Chloroflexota bacterium]